VWRELTGRVRETGEALHFIGLLERRQRAQPPGPPDAMLKRCHAEGVKQVRVHVLFDGRDVPETSALDYLDPLEALLSELSAQPERDYRVASGGGRMTVTMDRYEADWDMVARGYQLHVLGEGRGFRSARGALLTMRDEQPGITDQNLPGFVVVDADGAPVGRMRDGAAVVLFNFRGDRAIEITRALTEPTFSVFPRGPLPDLLFAGMMQYDGDLHLPERYLVDPPAIDRTLGEYLARNRIRSSPAARRRSSGT
jgi:2,3-bisphosphoglycerate-independent phosphoglycerate mutase